MRKQTAVRASVDLGPDPATGKRRQASKQGFATKREAEAALRELRSRPPRERWPSGRCARWGSTSTSGCSCKSRSTRGRPRGTATRWRSTGSRAGSARCKLQSLTPLQVERFYADLLAEGGRLAGLSPKTVRNTHTVLAKALADAERLGLVIRNARRRHGRRPSTTSSRRRGRPRRCSEFLDVVRDDRLYRGVRAAGHHRHASRRGARAAVARRRLRWPALSIANTLDDRSSDIVIGSAEDRPKSRRQVFLDDGTVDALASAPRRSQIEERLAAGPAWNTDSDYVFTDELGGRFDPDTFSSGSTDRRAQADLPRIRLHDLRHTYATLALKAGVHPKVVSERLGHATVGITLDLYSHVTPSIARDAADVVASRILDVPIAGSEPGQ